MINSEALEFGEYSEGLDTLTHNNVALFEQYEPISARDAMGAGMDAMNDDVAASYDSDVCAVDNLYMVPTW